MPASARRAAPPLRRPSSDALLVALILAGGASAQEPGGSAAPAAEQNPFCDTTYKWTQRSPEACLPWWYNASADQTECPYGRLLPGDVTYGYPVYSCTRHNEISECGSAYMVNFICVVYGYMPMIIIGVAFMELLITRGTRELLFILYVGAITLVNELVIKKLVMRPRPVGSCATTCGMPSSHSTFAIGFFVLMFLDASSRVNPMDVHEGNAAEGWGRRYIRWLCRRELAFLRGPLSNPVSLSNEAFVFICAQWGLLLVPVPISRVALHDHSFVQVVFGGLLGMLWAFIFYYCVYVRVARAATKYPDFQWPARWGFPLLRNTICLPWWTYEGQAAGPSELANAHELTSEGPLTIRMPLMKEEVFAAHGARANPVRRESVPGMPRGNQDDVLVGIEDTYGDLVGIRRGKRLKVAGCTWDGIAWPRLGGEAEDTTAGPDTAEEFEPFEDEEGGASDASSLADRDSSFFRC